MRTAGGVRFALDSLAGSRAREARPQEFYDDFVLRALDREGFVDQLYRAQTR